MAKSVPPDAIFVPYQTAVTFDILARDGVITTERKYLKATPEREAAHDAHEVLDRMITILRSGDMFVGFETPNAQVAWEDVLDAALALVKGGDDAIT